MWRIKGTILNYEVVGASFKSESSSINPLELNEINEIQSYCTVSFLLYYHIAHIFCLASL